MKRLYAKRLLLALLTCLPLCAAAYDFRVDGIYYTISSSSSNEVYVTEGPTISYYSGAVDIPSTVTYNDVSYDVTSIGDSAFYYSMGLTSVTIPSSVTSIGYRAFYHCTGLTSITIPSSVTSFGDYVFSGCTGLTSVTIPSSVTSIGSGMFSVCTGLTSITIPSSVTSIGSAAFSGCTGLTSITIPSSVTSIGSAAFSGCTGLTSVTIPSSVTSIGGSMFYGCTGLTSVTIPSSVTSIGGSAFRGCTGLTSVTIPSSVTSIGAGAFWDCTGLTSVTIPNSVTSIGELAFACCTGLTSVTIPGSVTSIGYNAFEGCTGLTSVNLSEGLTIIGYGMFYECTGLTSIDIPGSVTTIGSLAFWGCTGLTSVTIPSSVTSIGERAFEGCTGLTNVNLSEGLTSTGGGMFKGCTGLTSVTIPSSVTSTGDSMFEGCTGLTSVNLSEGLTSIGSFTFEGCTGLTSVTIPSSVTSIGSGAFWGCTGLTSVTIPSGVTSIGSSAFYKCTGLTSVTIPSSVTSFGGSMFYGCTGLTSIDIPGSVTTIGRYAFYGCTGLTSIDIPGSVTTIGDYALAYCGNLQSINVDSENAFYTSEDGVLYNITKTTLICCPAGKTSIEISTSVDTICAYAFSACKSLRTLTIPSSVSCLGSYILDGAKLGAVIIKSSNISWSSSILKGLDTSTPVFYYYYNSSYDYPTSDDYSGPLYRYNSSDSKRQYAASDTVVTYNSVNFDLIIVSTEGDIITTLDSLRVKVNGDVSGAWTATLNEESLHLSISGLEPVTLYSIYAYAYKGSGKYYYYNNIYSFTTTAVELTTGQPKVLSSTSAYISATTNLPDEETSVGFEWRKIDSPDEVASKSATAEIYEGTMAGVIKNLNASTYYKYRAYYKSASDSMYYSEWVGIDTDDYSYFEPTVKTGDVEVSDSYVTVKGYALQGTEDIEDQGFEYWVSSSSAKSSRVSSKASDDGVTRVTVDGQKMTATLTDLLAGTTYEIRAYATTASGTTYGETVQFTTAEATGISSVTVSGSEGLELLVRQRDGVQIAVSGGEKDACSYRIFSMTGSMAGSGKVAADGSWYTVADANTLKGIYVIIATDGSETKARKLFVK